MELFVDTESDNGVMVLLAGDQIHPRYRGHHYGYLSDLVAAESDWGVLLHSGGGWKLYVNGKGAEFTYECRHIAELEYDPEQGGNGEHNKGTNNDVSSSLSGFKITHFLVPFKSVRPVRKSSLIALKG